MADLEYNGPARSADEMLDRINKLCAKYLQALKETPLVAPMIYRDAVDVIRSMGFTEGDAIRWLTPAYKRKIRR